MKKKKLEDMYAEYLPEQSLWRWIKEKEKKRKVDEK